MGSKCERCKKSDWHVGIRLGKVGFRYKWVDLCYSCDKLTRKVRNKRTSKKG